MLDAQNSANAANTARANAQPAQALLDLKGAGSYYGHQGEAHQAPARVRRSDRWIFRNVNLTVHAARSRHSKPQRRG